VGDVVADLREMAKLYDTGLITTAEYALAKARPACCTRVRISR
jgi:hypothetical protein